MCKLGALQRHVDLQGPFIKIGDFIKLKGFLVEFIENRRSWENQRPPENRQINGLFWASPLTMHLVCTLLILVSIFVLRKRAEYCFESTVSEKRTHWASLSLGANSVSSARHSVSSIWHTNNRLRGAHWVRSPELSEPQKTHWARCLKPYFPKRPPRGPFSYQGVSTKGVRHSPVRITNHNRNQIARSWWST